MTARVMGGKFKLEGGGGPPVGAHHLKVFYSSADVPSLTTKDAPEGVMSVTKASPDSTEELKCEIKEGGNHLALELKQP